MAVTERRRDYSQPVRNALWATSQGRCAFPDCNRPLVVQDRGRWVTVGQIAHINALNANGARFDPELSIDYLNSFDNLLLLCQEHHALIDGLDSPYTTAEVVTFKQTHLAQVQSLAEATRDDLLVSPPLANHYLERPEVARALDALRAGKNVVLTGISGAGKTQIAVDAFRRLADDFTFRWWLKASNAEVLGGDLAIIGTRIGIQRAEGEPEESHLNRILSRLEQLPGWLIALDDLPDPGSASGLLGLANGRVVVTTQNAGWFGAETVISVGGLEESAAITLLRLGYRTEQNQETLREIAEISAWHPLAVIQASAFGAESGTTASSFLDMARSHHSDILALGHDPTHASLSASVSASLKLLSPDARTVARMLAILAPDPIDLIVDAEAADNDVHVSHIMRQPVRRESALSELRRFSFIEREGARVSMHALVRAIIRGAATPAEQLSATLNALVLVMLVLPDRSDSPSRWPQMELLLPHLISLIDAVRASDVIEDKFVSTLYVRLAGYYHSRGQLELAKSLLEELQELVGSKDDDDSKATLGTVLNNLANVHAAQGELELAEREYEEAIRLKEATYGPEHYLTGVSYAALAAFLISVYPDDSVARGRARELNRKALETYKSHDRPEWIMDAAVDLAEMSITDGDFVSARQYLVDAKATSDENPDLWEERAKIFLTQSMLFEAEGEPVNAAREARRSVEVARSGARYSMMLGKALSTHGRLLVALGATDSGLTQIRRAIDVMQHVEPDAVDTYRAVGNLGSALISDSSTYQEGIELLVRSEEFMLEHLPRGHRTIVTAQMMLLRGYFAGSPDQAKVKSLAERMLPHAEGAVKEELEGLLATFEPET